MGCPIHIWLPMMGVAAPFVRVARTRVKAALSRPAREAEAPREVKHWAPVGQAASNDAAESSR